MEANKTAFKIKIELNHDGRKVLANAIIPTEGDEIIAHYKIGKDHYSRTINKDDLKNYNYGEN